MGYRDDFYVAENLIGYTGSIHNSPSVYFQSATEYGHITQYHALPLNIGRESVHDAANYTIANEQTENGLVCVERDDGEIFHTSRNLFVAAATLSNEQRAVLLQSIIKCPEKKQLATIHGTDREKVMEQYNNKLDLLNQIDGGNR